MTEVEVWWGRIEQVREEYADDLDPVEVQRMDAYVRADDSARFLLGCTMVRRVLARRSSLPAASISLDRTCPQCGGPHGKVRADGVELSVTHAGDLVGVAVGDAPLGLDVEQVDPTIDVDGLARLSLSEQERAALPRDDPGTRARAFTALWTRKEAVVKATGDGLRTDLRTITGPPAGFHLMDLTVDRDYAAALAVISPEPPDVRTFRF